MQKESQTYKIAPAERLASVSEYYFSKKLKEVAQMNAEGSRWLLSIRANRYWCRIRDTPPILL